MTKTPRNLNPEQYARLKAEISAPYRGLRQFIYLACGGSGFIGAIVFIARLAAGKEVDSALPNLALQIVVVAITIWLFRLEQKAARKQERLEREKQERTKRLEH
jgi:cbb3-type cytochrome oxidase subunit 3